MGLLGDPKDFFDEEALVNAAAKTLVPALSAAFRDAVADLLAGAEGFTLTITVNRKAKAE